MLHALILLFHFNHYFSTELLFHFDEGVESSRAELYFYFYIFGQAYMTFLNQTHR